MSDDHKPGSPIQVPPAEVDRIGPLLRLAGPREAIPADRMRRVRAAVHAEWRQHTRARSRRVTVGWSLGAVAAAALVLLGVRLAIRDDSAGPLAQPEVATIEAVAGTVRLVSSSEGGGLEHRMLQIGDRVGVGEVIETPGGLASLRLSGGASVRLDRGTQLHLVSETALVLGRGAIYVDSGDGYAGSLEVRTALGVARDIGTRFEVRFTGSALRVRVRDGLVRLSQDQQSHDAHPGDELTLDAKGGVVRRPVAVFGAEWAWLLGLTQPFELEGRTLAAFLDWIAKDNGWQLRFADAAIELKSQTTILHGSILGLSPSEALAAVLPTSGVEHTLENGVLLIHLSDGGAKD